MSRWTKRTQQLNTVVPIDNLLREKENKNSVAVGTVMKFGMMQFTSIRSSCFNMGALNSTSPIQNSVGPPSSPTDISSETTPKPRKFFKSRNAAPPAEIQQQIAIQQQQIAIQHQQQLSQKHLANHIHSSSEDQSSPRKTVPKKKSAPKREKMQKLKAEKTPKIKKENPSKSKEVVVLREDLSESEQDVALTPRRGRQISNNNNNINNNINESTRHSGRVQRKLINYNEDQGEEEFIMRTEKRIAPKNLKMLQQQQKLRETIPVLSPFHLDSQNHSEESCPAINHPPIVLRISKGTSRLVSTDNDENEDGVITPSRGNSSGDENKNLTNSNAMESTDELIAVLSGDNSAAILEQKPPEQKAERIRIRIKKDYIRSYNDSLKEQEEARAKQQQLQEEELQPPTLQSEQGMDTISQQFAGRTTRRRGKQQENTPRISPIVSEFDSQSSVLGSSISQNTTAGSSIVTSDIDTSQQSSLAAAPPSIQLASENNSMEQYDVPVAPQKGRRGRKKTVQELKPPEPKPIDQPKITTRGRTSRIDSSPEKMIIGRSTRSTRNNQIQQSPEEEISVVEKAPHRFFTRKRKNVSAEIQSSFSPSPDGEEEDQTSALNLSQKSSGSSELSLPPAVSSLSSPNVTEYKHKKLVKRSWELEQSIKQSMDFDYSPKISKSPAKQSNHVQKQSDISDNPGVKLLISKKKGSIFKSRALDRDESDNKKRNLYKHKWDEDAELLDAEGENNKPENLTKTGSENTDASFFEGEPSGLTRFTRVKKPENNIKETFLADFEEDDHMVTGLKCDRNAKNYYQVVRNVKKAHQIQEIGEFQEMDDDVEYLLDALQPNSQVALRCLSALQLASKCMTPSFRMHIRAHGIVPKFFKALEDATNDPSLGLCTAMVMFALSQDTLKMDLDRGSLELMLNLLECEGSQKQCPKDVMNKQHMERKQKVRELCEEIQSQGKSIHLNLDNITAAQLAMESLLSLTSKRAGEWLKEDLRELGGIEHIIKTVCDCCNQITEYVDEWTEPLLEKLNKIGRCLRILENVTSNNEENQRYILHYKSQVFINTLCKFFNLLSKELVIHPTTEKSAKDSAAVAIRETLIPLLKVIINLTHPFNERAIGSVFFGDFNEIFQICINLLLFGVNYVWSRQQFDFSLLTLVLLSNLTQLNEKNRQSIMHLEILADEFGKEKQAALKSLIEYFYKCEDKAKTLKKLTDDLIDSSKQRDAKQEEAVNALIQNSGTHMENTILGSFTSTLIGFIIMSNSNNETTARNYLRNGKFKDMVAVLMQYYEFLNLTVSSDASSMAQLKTIKNVMDFLRNADAE